MCFLSLMLILTFHGDHRQQSQFRQTLHEHVAVPATRHWYCLSDTLHLHVTIHKSRFSLKGVWLWTRHICVVIFNGEPWGNNREKQREQIAAGKHKSKWDHRLYKFNKRRVTSTETHRDLLADLLRSLGVAHGGQAVSDVVQLLQSGFIGLQVLHTHTQPPSLSV